MVLDQVHELAAMALAQRTDQPADEQSGGWNSLLVDMR